MPTHKLPGGRWATPLVVIAVTCVIAVAATAVPGSDAPGILLLEVAPVALVAWRYGWRTGSAGAIVALALTTAIAICRHVPGAGSAITAGVVCFAVAGGGVGALAARARRKDVDSRWFEMSNDLLVEASLDGYFTRLSESWESCLGWTREELMQRPFRELIHPDDLVSTNVYADALDERPGEVVNFENRYQAKDGSWRWLLWCARSDDQRKYAIARDITDRKLLEVERAELLAQLAEMARTDALTGLPNRRAWDEELVRSLAIADRSQEPLALAMVDLDDFKQLNDRLGHAAGDAFLAEAASAWRDSLRAADFVARYGGEEFSVLLRNCPYEEVVPLLERLRGATPRGETCSIGVAFFVPGDAPDDLLGRADNALYAAKHRGRNCVVVATSPLEEALMSTAEVTEGSAASRT